MDELRSDEVKRHNQEGNEGKRYVQERETNESDLFLEQFGDFMFIFGHELQNMIDAFEQFFDITLSNPLSDIFLDKN